MAGANYESCMHCGGKALYVGEDSLGPAVVFCDTACLDAYVAVRENPLRARLLAVSKLAADTPQFFNPLDAFAAQAIRDRVLAEESAMRSGQRASDG